MADGRKRIWVVRSTNHLPERRDEMSCRDGNQVVFSTRNCFTVKPKVCMEMGRYGVKSTMQGRADNGGLARGKLGALGTCCAVGGKDTAVHK